MSFLTVSYFYWHILGNKDMCAQFLRERDLHISKITENGTETQTTRVLWKRVKNKYGMKSSRSTNILDYQYQEDRQFLIQSKNIQTKFAKLKN